MLNAIKIIRNRCNTLVPFQRAFPPGSGYGGRGGVLSVHWLDSHCDIKGKKFINTKNMRPFFFFEGCSCIHQCTGVEEVSDTTNETLLKPEVIVLRAAITTDVGLDVVVVLLFLRA